MSQQMCVSHMICDTRFSTCALEVTDPTTAWRGNITCGASKIITTGDDFSQCQYTNGEFDQNMSGGFC